MPAKSKWHTVSFFFLRGHILTREQAVKLRWRQIEFHLGTKPCAIGQSEQKRIWMSVISPAIESEEEGYEIGGFDVEVMATPLWGREIDEKEAHQYRRDWIQFMLESDPPLMAPEEIFRTYLLVVKKTKERKHSVGGMLRLFILPEGEIFPQEMVRDNMILIGPDPEEDKNIKVPENMYITADHFRYFEDASEGGFCEVFIPRSTWEPEDYFHPELMLLLSAADDPNMPEQKALPAPASLSAPEPPAPKIEIPEIIIPRESYTVKVDTSKLDESLTRAKAYWDERIIGQDRAKRHLLDILARERAGFTGRRPQKKLLLGPTGTGKTLSVKEFAKIYIGEVEDEDSVALVEMSNLVQDHHVSKLIGASPEYVGYGDLPLLSQIKIDWPHFLVKFGKDKVDAILRDPSITSPDPRISAEKIKWQILIRFYKQYGPYRSVVLLDEFEKAHPAVRKVLLNVLQEGKLTMGNGEVTDFRNSVIFMTSNIGSDRIKRIIGGNAGPGFRIAKEIPRHDLNQIIYNELIAGKNSELERIFEPEFIGRIRNHIVVFETLTDEQYRMVVDIQLRQIEELVIKILKKSNALPIRLSFDKTFREFLFYKGIDPRYGGRVLAEMVEDKVTTELSYGKLSGEIQPGDMLLFLYAGTVGGGIQLDSDRIEILRVPRSGEKVQ